MFCISFKNKLRTHTRAVNVFQTNSFIINTTQTVHMLFWTESVLEYLKTILQWKRKTAVEAQESCVGISSQIELQYGRQWHSQYIHISQHQAHRTLKHIYLSTINQKECPPTDLFLNIKQEKVTLYLFPSINNNLKHVLMYLS